MQVDRQTDVPRSLVATIDRSALGTASAHAFTFPINSKDITIYTLSDPEQFKKATLKPDYVGWQDYNSTIVIHQAIVSLSTNIS